MVTEQLPASDITPGVAAPVTDRRDFECALDKIAVRLEPLHPLVKRNNGLFVLYEHWPLPEKRPGIVCQAQSAQAIKDYCEAMMPRGTKIQWVILP